MSKLESIKPKDMEFNSGYISPDGRLYECPYAAHSTMADVICLVFGYDREDARLSLEKKNWIKISRGNFNFFHEATRSQIDTIFDWIVDKGDGDSFVHNGQVKAYKKLLEEY